MKDKPFFKIIVTAISIAVMFTFVLVLNTQAQTYVTVAVDHDIEVEDAYEWFSIEYLATTYFEIEFDIKEGGGEDVKIILIADEDAGDMEVDDDETFIYYIGDDAYYSSMMYYHTIGTKPGDDIEIPAFQALFVLAALDDPGSDWASYTWTGAEVEKITIIMVADSTSTTDIVKVKEYKFEDVGGDDHGESQDFGDYTSLSDADWDSFGGGSIIDTSDDTLYLRSTYLQQYEDFYAQYGYYPDTCLGAVEICDGKDNNCDGVIPDNELDKDGDGFMICEGDCDDNDSAKYPGAPGTYEGKDNNCDGHIDHSEKRRFSYTLDARIFPLWMQSQQLGTVPTLPVYTGYPEIQRQMWYPYQLTSPRQQSIKTQSLFFHPALFTWLLNLNYYPFYSPFMAFNIDAQYDINFNQYLNSIIYSPFVFESYPENQTTQTITLLSIYIEASDTTLTIGETSQLTVRGYSSDKSYPYDSHDLTNDAGTIYVSSNENIVEVKNDGTVTAVGLGKATITVTNSGITDQISIEVRVNIKGHWAGTWEAWLTDPNGLPTTDPNTDEIVTTMSGEIVFHITQQQSSGGTYGTVKITGWDVDPNQAPDDWPGDWTAEDNEVDIAGWIDKYTKYLKARYYYYAGQEDSAEYRINEDYENIKGLYTWMFDSDKLNITDSDISGQFTITGVNEYYEIGVFSAAKFTP